MHLKNRIQSCHIVLSVSQAVHADHVVQYYNKKCSLKHSTFRPAY